MKKFLSALVSLLLIFGLVCPFHPVAKAAAPATAVVSSAAVEAGEAVRIDVKIADNPGLAAWTFELEWDPAHITLAPDSIEAGEPFSNGTLLTNAKESGKLLLTWYAPRDVIASGVLFSMQFLVGQDTADGTYPIEIRCQKNNTINTAEETVPVTAIGGTVTVGSELPPVPPIKPTPSERPQKPEQPEKPELQAEFSDVPKNLYYYDAVQWAVQNQVTRGMTETTFAPDAVCSRGQMVTLLWRAAGSPEPETQKHIFEDVARDSYCSKAVLWAAENHITQGTSPTTFSPNQPVNRGQVVTLMWRQQGSQTGMGKVPFADVAADAYYAEAVSWAVGRKITTGTAAGTFNPSAPCTRGQIVTFLYRNTVQ